MSLQTRIKEESTAALKARDEVRLTTLRGLTSAFTNELVAQKRKPTEELGDDEALAVIKRNVKQRKDSIEQFQQGGRTDLVEKEQAELTVLEKFLPAQASDEEIHAVAQKKIEELGVADPSGMGPLMGAIMKELGGNADGGDVKRIVSELLQ